MPRRISLPGADELFRTTSRRHAAEPTFEAPRRSSGRVRHDEKITVYLTAEELLDVEHARLTLRHQHGIATDRGRLIREAVSIVLADLDVNGEGSVLVDRMRK